MCASHRGDGGVELACGRTSRSAVFSASAECGALMLAFSSTVDAVTVPYERGQRNEAVALRIVEQGIPVGCEPSAQRRDSRGIAWHRLALRRSASATTSGLHTRTRSQPASRCAAMRAPIPPALSAAAMLMSSLKTTPRKPYSPRRISSIQTARITGRMRIDLRIGDMRHHHRFGTGGDRVGERQQIGRDAVRPACANPSRAIEMRVFAAPSRVRENA